MTREEAIEVLHHTVAFESGFAEAKRMAIEALENALTFSTATDAVKALREAEYRGYMKAVAERPQGKWLLSDLQSQADNDNGNYAYVCTNCNHTDIHAKTQKVPYCWWCGAKMKGEVE